MGGQRAAAGRKALGQSPRRGSQTKKRVYWHTLFGCIEVTEQLYRLSHSRRQLRPFSNRAGVKCRGCSRPLQRALVDFASDVSFNRATEKLVEHYGVELSSSTVRQITQHHGASLLEQQQQLVDHLGPEAGLEQLMTQTDGSMVPLVENSLEASDKRKNKSLLWGEARLSLARDVNSVTPRLAATMEEAQQAGAVWLDCVKRAGGGAKTKIHCVGDGAPWIIEQARQRFKDQGSYLIDFYHVSEYLAAAGTLIAGQKAKGWLEKQQRRLKDNLVGVIIEELLPHIERGERKEEEAPVRKCHRYLTKHREQMNYKGALQAGLPIGSGEIEGGHRWVVQERLKKAGAWWKRENAKKMLALRINRANGEWRSYWQQQRQAAS
ncbi:MAG TPA: ISKra4 family transposase [Blastocatellia bacterium]|nr:ISKra4 family transposase [Blastocatellia bacterium]